MTTVGLSTTGVAPAAATSKTRWVGLAGVIFGVMLAVAFSLTWGIPDAKNATKDRTWILKHSGQLTGSVILTVAAVIIGLYFLTWLHSQLAGKEGSWMGTLSLVGIVVFAMSGTVDAGIHLTMTDAKHLSTGSLQLMTSLAQNFNYPMTCIALAVFYLSAGYLIRRSGVLPGWLATASWVLAFVAATVIVGFVALLGTVLWMIVVGAILTARQPVEK